MQYEMIDDKPVKNTLRNWALFLNPVTGNPQIRGIANFHQPEIGVAPGDVVITSAVQLMDTNRDSDEPRRYVETLNSIYILI